MCATCWNTPLSQQLFWAGEKGEEKSFECSNMWQKVHLEQENLDFWPCMALNMSLKYQKLKFKRAVINQYFFQIFKSILQCFKQGFLLSMILTF